MKIAIYCRTSTVDQHPENQKRELEEYAQRMGWTEYEVFEEKESTRNTRPVQYDLYLRGLKREYETLLVWKLDRWGRSLKELIEQITELHERGVHFVSLKENIDLTTSSGKLMFHIISSFAEYERNIISERTKLALARRRAEGKPVGRQAGAKDKKKRKTSGYYDRFRN